jgi:hypothetical protein
LVALSTNVLTGFHLTRVAAFEKAGLRASGEAMQAVFSLEPASVVSSIVTTTCCAVHPYLFWTLQIIYSFSLAEASQDLTNQGSQRRK